MKSTWFCGSWAGLGRSISPQPSHFGLCPPGFPTNFSRRIFLVLNLKNSQTPEFSPFNNFQKIWVLTKFDNCFKGL
jgi:hypothetical protein